MKLQPGDTVSFINEKQDGRVIRIIQGGRVVVEISDGFEIEVQEKELVKTGTINELQQTPENNPEVEDDLSSANTSVRNLCSPGTICLVAVPVSTGAVLTGKVNYFLVNNTEYDLAFTFYGKSSEDWLGINREILEPDSEILLDTFDRDELTELESFHFEALLFHVSQRSVITHIRKDSGILLPGIAESLKGVDGPEAFAKIFELYTEAIRDDDRIRELIKTLGTRESSGAGETASNTGTKMPPVKPGTHITEKIIDLHIEELRPDIQNLSHSEMLEIQMRVFAEEMNHAVRNNFKSVVFIHGVGNGILKRKIREELKNYKGITVHDGEFNKFGYGATEILF